MTNRETDGDPDGECAAEIHRLEQCVLAADYKATRLEIKWQQACHDKQHLQDQIDACRPYLKEGETVADALGRLSEEAEWQPIATAPAPGVRVLATWDNTWNTEGEHIEVCEAGECGEWFYSFDGDAPTTAPTHWMPLPAAPDDRAQTTEEI